MILKDTKVQQGDFARTADSAANQQRILAAQVKDLAAELGRGLLPMLKLTLQTVNALLGPLTSTIGVLTGIRDPTQAATERLRELGLAMDDVKSKVDGTTAAFTTHTDALRGGRTQGAAMVLALDDLVVAETRAAEEAQGWAMRQRAVVVELARTDVATGRATRAVRVFARLSGEELAEWLSETKDKLADASLAIGGLGEDWKQTARETVRSARRMARDAATLASDLDKLADIRAPQTFKTWLVDQGPGWIHGYVDATKSGKDKIEDYWRSAAGSALEQEDALRRVTTKVKDVDRAIDKLPSYKKIRVDVDVHASGISSTPEGQSVATALANELVRGQTS